MDVRLPLFSTYYGYSQETCVVSWTMSSKQPDDVDPVLNSPPYPGHGWLVRGAVSWPWQISPPILSNGYQGCNIVELEIVSVVLC